MSSSFSEEKEPNMRSEALSTDEFKVGVLYADDSFVVIDKPQVNSLKYCCKSCDYYYIYFFKLARETAVVEPL